MEQLIQRCNYSIMSLETISAYTVAVHRYSMTATLHKFQLGIHLAKDKYCQSDNYVYQKTFLMLSNYFMFYLNFPLT